MPCWHPEEQLGTGWTLTASAPPFAFLGVRFASGASGFILSRRIDNGFVWCFAPCRAFSLPKYAHAWPSGEALRPAGSGASGFICSGWPGKWVRLVIPPKLFAPAGSGAIGGRYFRGGTGCSGGSSCGDPPAFRNSTGGVDSELRRRQWTGRKGVVSSELPVMVRPAAPGYAALASDGMHWTTCGRRPRGTGCGRGIARSSRLLDRLAG